MNKKTVQLTQEQYEEIINTLRTGFAGMEPSPSIANALIIEANLGLRIVDVLKLKLSDIVTDGDRHRLEITEQKTGKARIFTVPEEVYDFISSIEANGTLINVSERQIQKKLKKTVDYLGYSENIGTHSFRKMFASKVYENSGYNIRIAQEVLQHSSPATTQRYLSVSAQDIESALEEATNLI